MPVIPGVVLSKAKEERGIYQPSLGACVPAPVEAG